MADVSGDKVAVSLSRFISKEKGNLVIEMGLGETGGIADFLFPLLLSENRLGCAFARFHSA